MPYLLKTEKSLPLQCFPMPFSLMACTFIISSSIFFSKFQSTKLISKTKFILSFPKPQHNNYFSVNDTPIILLAYATNHSRDQSGSHSLPLNLQSSQLCFQVQNPSSFLHLNCPFTPNHLTSKFQLQR